MRRIVLQVLLVAGLAARAAQADVLIVRNDAGTTTSHEGEIVTLPDGLHVRTRLSSGMVMEYGPFDPTKVKIIRTAAPPTLGGGGAAMTTTPGATGMPTPPSGAIPLPGTGALRTPPAAGGGPTPIRPLLPLPVTSATPTPLGALPRPVAATTPLPTPGGLPQPVFTPFPTPAMIPAVTPYYAPSPTPAILPGMPAPQPLPKQPVAFERSYLDRLKEFDLTAIPDFLNALIQADYFPYVIGVPAFIILFWVVPGKLLRARARRGDFNASLWVMRVKWAGPFALVFYLFGTLRSARRSKVRCPVCKKPLDAIDSYTDFNFAVCPHCGENITPVHDLNDYIQHLVEQLERDVRSRRGQYSDSNVEKDVTLKLVRAMITRSVRARASDIHIDSGPDGANVRIRVDGVLLDMLFLPKPLVPSVVSAIKVMAKLDIAERRTPQDGKFSVWVDKTDLDIRVNTSPAIHGEKVSMRLLDKRTITVGPAGLGFESQNLGLFEQSIRRPHGIIVVTGPAGSGKSTTLYVALNAINTGEKNIITLEDPIEYELKGLTQMQVNPAVNFTFATGLRTIVRQDPNVIMVGEVRDRETAEMAIEAAITGHLVMTTMHTIDTTTVFTRLSDMGIDSRRYAAALVIIIAQRLVRMNCPECRKPYPPDQKALEQLRLTQGAKDIVFLKGMGCLHCLQTGYYGRSGLFEILSPDRETATMLEQNAAASKIREVARHRGMRNIREEGVLKIMRGQTTVEEVIRATM